MIGFGLVQLQSAGERIEDFQGDSGKVTTLHPCVILHADPGEQRDLLASKAWHASPAASSEADLLRGDPVAARV